MKGYVHWKSKERKAAITIKNGDDFSIEAKHPASNFSSELHGSRWVIHSGELRSHQWPVDQAPEITITLPRDFVAEELNVELGVGSLTSAPLAAQKQNWRLVLER